MGVVRLGIWKYQEKSITLQINLGGLALIHLYVKH